VAFLIKLLSFMADNKIIALEEKIAHIQHMLEDLNMVVFRQGETIENLNNHIKELKEKLETLKSPQSTQEVINDDKPPHY
jgi:SlyX protein|tara:strand:- start:373 stop:612 length:240 start_codon:yes stop_codon:yes gene_type:complete